MSGHLDAFSMPKTEEPIPSKSEARPTWALPHTEAMCSTWSTTRAMVALAGSASTKTG